MKKFKKIKFKDLKVYSDFWDKNSIDAEKYIKVSETHIQIQWSRVYNPNNWHEWQYKISPDADVWIMHEDKNPEPIPFLTENIKEEDLEIPGSPDLRDYFAAKYMQACRSNPGAAYDMNELAEESYVMADLMLRARVKKSTS